MTVAGLLLAAGAGRRFGRPKALVAWGGAPLVVRGLTTLAAGGTSPSLVVLGAAARQVRDEVELADEQVVVADNWAEGIGASLRAGLAALAENSAEAAVVMLVDQPLVGAEAVRRLVDAISASERGDHSNHDHHHDHSDHSDHDNNADALVATYRGRPGHPVALKRRVWREVAELAVGEVGARAWLSSHPDRVRELPCDGTGSPADLDTPADLPRLERLAIDPRLDRTE